ncbi:MAG: prepilin-type N-terminal cleavage/methylation domain-containing protein [Vicinamibacteria bacterium]
MTLTSRSDRGFSLVELMVAMLVTMIISSAIYGLMAGGQNAFRREPELSDRQQNIRVAMDMIMNDVANAGSGMPAFMQTFTPGLNAFASAPMGLDGQRTDELEIMTNDGSFDNETVCADPGGAHSENIFMVRGQTGVTVGRPVMLIFEDGTWTFRNTVDISPNSPSTSTGNCAAHTDHAKVNFNAGAGDSSGMNTPSGICQPSANGIGNAGSGINGCPSSPSAGNPCCMVTQVSFAVVVRYRIRNDAGGVPVLQRSSTANLGVWNTVASGIEDLQVQYTQANGTVSDPAPLVSWNNVDPVVNNGSIITQVQVTLSARSEAQNLQGATTNSSGATRVRGRLTSTGSPRAALYAIAAASPAPSPTPLWQ